MFAQTGQYFLALTFFTGHPITKCWMQNLWILNKNQIKSNQITFIVTSPQHKCLGEWNSYERAPDSAEKQQTIYIWTDSAKKQQTIYLWTDSAKKQQTIYLWTDSAKKTALEHLQCSRQCKNNNLHMDRQCKKNNNNLHMDRYIYIIYII